MDIYITDLETGSRLQLPMLPEGINVTSSAKFGTYAIMNVGDVKLPAGETLTGFSWSGMLPGEKRKDAPYVRSWSDPNGIQSLWSSWRANKKKLRLMVTETPINHDVYLESYSVDYEHGYGDYNYQISFIQAKDLKVYVSGASTPSESVSAQTAQTSTRPSPPAATTYTVVKGDSLWAIAQKTLGAGSRYDDLYQANTAVIDPANQKYGNSKYTIYPGQVLTIPG